jgi:hypothetical protein
MHEDRPATALGNDRIELLTLNKGGAFVSLILMDDSGKTNPMWNPVALARMTKRPSRFGDSLGHFLCWDSGEAEQLIPKGTRTAFQAEGSGGLDPNPGNTGSVWCE